MSKEKRKAIGQNGEPSLREQRSMLCENLSFISAEAYKQMRANLLFALPDQEGECRAVGVTSSIRGEGKSTTAINLAYTLAETGKMVLLIDADMRVPTVAKKLAITGKPGLSNVLAGLCTPDKVVQTSYNMSNWHIMPAGDIPPNPSELLGSEQMGKLLKDLAATYEFIVVDLPPANIVSDALAVSPWVNGLLVVVRAGYTEKQALTECMRNLQVLGNKLLGFVLTDTEQMPKRYGKYGRYGRYSKYGKYGKYGRYSKYQKYSSYGYYYGKKSTAKPVSKTVETVRQTVEQAVQENAEERK